MATIKTSIGRRAFLKSSALAGGGMMLGFSWFASCQSKTAKEVLAMPDEWFEINAFLKIGDNGLATIYTPNPEFGQNVRTSMPMLVAEELDMDWNNVLVEQAPFHPSKYGFQFTGGSQGIRNRWEPLRMAGASARYMLKKAAAQSWQVPMEEVTTASGMLYHKPSGKSAGYGEMASAAAKVPVPEEVALKEVDEFKIIGKSQKNVDAKDILTGKSMFGSDYDKEGMLIAMIVHPPAFGMTLESIDDSISKAMPGIRDVLTIKSYRNDFEKGITVNVGMIQGGSSANVIAEESQAVVDVRVHNMDDASFIENKILNLKPKHTGTSLQIEGGFGRPPMERTARNQRLWTLAKHIGQSMHLELEQVTAGGGSDGNTTSLYTATLDGLGTVGDGAHARHEFIFKDKFIERTTLLAMLLSAKDIEDEKTVESKKITA